MEMSKGLSGGRRVGGSGGLSPPDAGEVFKKFGKNYNFRPIFQHFNENFVINASNFSRKFGKYLELCIYRGFGGFYYR